MMKESTSVQCLASLSCALAMTMIGTCFVWLTPLMVTIVGPGSPVAMTTNESSWLASTIELGMIAATIPIGLLADRYGRKTVLLSAGPIALIAWILVLTTRNIYILFCVRVLQGFSMGIGYIVAPMYIAEISEPRIRGLLSGQFQTFYYLGTVYAYTIGALVKYDTYALCMAVMPILFMAMFASMPESPYYLLMIGQYERAKQTLCWLRAAKDVDEEFNKIKTNVDEDILLKFGWKDLIATKSDRKALLIVLLVCIIKYMNGMTAISLYISQTLAQTAQGRISYNTVTIILGILLTITTIIAAFLSDRVGRKPLLIISSFGSAIFSSIVAVYYYLETEYTTVSFTSYSWIMVTSLIAFCIICNLGVGPLVQTIQAECFPSRTRSVGGAFIQMISSCVAFTNIKMYQEIDDNLGVYFNYVIFAIVSFVGCIFLYIILPETAGRSLGQIQKELNDSQVTAVVGNDSDTAVYTSHM